jgi:predicted transcriptional regulator
MQERADIQEALLALGEKRMQAAILSMLLDQSPVTTHEIMEETGLRQPEVSIGVRDLKARGWLESQPIPREGKGRPMNQYARNFEDEKFLHFYQQAAGNLKAKADAAAWLIQERIRR